MFLSYELYLFLPFYFIYFYPKNKDEEHSITRNKQLFHIEQKVIHLEILFLLLKIKSIL